MYIVPELLEEIFLRLPLKSILKFKTVSKQWRSVLESNMFVEKRMNVSKSGKIIAAYNCDCGDRPRIIHEARLGDQVFVYLHCFNARPSMICDSRPLLTCDGLVCIAEPDSIIVLNPSTGQLLRFPEPLSSRFINGEGSDFYRGNWVMGFGRDKVTGSYKVTKMCLLPREEGCDVLDVETGQWKNLSLPTYMAQVGRKSVSVNGSIYWLSTGSYLVRSVDGILALDLHKEEFHYVSVPDKWVKQSTLIANLDDRLTIANTPTSVYSDWRLEICSMNAHEEIWSKTYSISLDGLLAFKLPRSRWCMWFTPLAVSKEGDLIFYNNYQWLFKYCPETRELHCLSSDICVISPYLENLVPLRSESGHHPDPDDNKIRTSSCGFFTKHPEPGSGISKFFKRIRLGIPQIVFTTLVIVHIWINL
ncbi:unnamed protein product [Arabidopsis halleri]